MGENKRTWNVQAENPRGRITSPVDPELADATVVHCVEGVPVAKLEEKLWQEKRIRTRSQGVRQSCQIFNNEAEIDATLKGVRALAAQPDPFGILSGKG